MDKDREKQLISQVPPGTLFEHYKGHKYKILGIARHSETSAMLVVYQALYNSSEFGDQAIWARPLEMFLETVTIDGKEQPRFRRIG